MEDNDKENGIELYRKHRPRRLKDVKGQPAAVAAIEGWLKKGSVPHAILISGKTGTGKTTLARILKRELGCGDADFAEVNNANLRGIDSIREISSRVGLAPMAGKCRMWILDEFAQATREAMQATLKLFEDTPPHVYFVLCTTDPDKLLPTVLGRCARLELSSIPPSDMTSIIRAVTEKEGVNISDKVMARIVEVADGSARNALQLLHKIINLESEQEKLDAVIKTNTKRKSYELVSTLVFKPKAKWSEVAKILMEIDDEPETIRRQVLGLASKVLLEEGRARAFFIITAFEADFFTSGKAGLIRACYEVFSNKDE